MGALSDPSEAELDFLQQRQQFKERFRINHMKESGSANDRPIDKNKSDNFGTFFGPSEPTISRRVLEERKALMPGLTKLASKVRSSDDQGKKSLKTPSSTTTKSGSTLKIIKKSRDYSFLSLNEAETPATSKGESRLRKDSVSNSSNARTPVSGTNRASVAKLKPEKKQHWEDKERHHEKRQDLMPRQSSLQRKVPKVNETSSTKSLPASKKQLEQRKDLHQPTKLKPKPDKTQFPPQQENSTKSLPAPKKQLEQRKVLHQPAKAKLKPDDKTQSPPQRQNLDRYKASSSKLPSSTKHDIKKEKQILQPNNTRVMPKQQKSPKNKQIKRDVADSSYDDKVDVSSMIQSIFRRKRKHIREEYSDSDDDDAAMVSTFDDIIREEIRSSKIARKEDEVERLRLEEEEKQERFRKAKKQKLKAYKSDSNDLDVNDLIDRQKYEIFMLVKST